MSEYGRGERQREGAMEGERAGGGGQERWGRRRLKEMANCMIVGNYDLHEEQLCTERLG